MNLVSNEDDYNHITFRKSLSITNEENHNIQINLFFENFAHFNCPDK